MTKDIIRQAAVLISLLITIFVNVLSNALPLNGRTAGEISDSFDILFVPAGYVFSIWGLIYLGLLAYAIYQLLPSQRENPRLRQTGWWFVLSGVANSTWIFLWHYDYVALSVVAMLVLLVSLLNIYLRLGNGKTAVSRAEKWLVQLPFSIYLGWITVATIANITVFLYDINWNGFGLSAEIWAVIMLGVATVVAGLMTASRGDIAYLLVLVWAFAGIGVAQAETPLVANTAWLAAGTVTIMVILSVIQSLRKENGLALVTN